MKNKQEKPENQLWYLIMDQIYDQHNDKIYEYQLMYQLEEKLDGQLNDQLRAWIFYLQSNYKRANS